MSKKKTKVDPEQKLVQTRIDEYLHTWLEKKASEEGLSVASYVRRMIILEHRASEARG